jgi:hypothetical protein
MVQAPKVARQSGGKAVDEALRNANEAAWVTKAARLEKLFSNLPRQQKTYVMLIPGIARQLLLMVPNSCKSGPKAAGAKKGLQRLAQSTGSTIKNIEALSQNARDALYIKPAVLAELTRNLRLLYTDAKMAVEIPAEDYVRGRRKQNRPSQSTKITRCVKLHYRALTGQNPTRSNAAFVKFLDQVFEILGIKASANSQAAIPEKARQTPEEAKEAEKRREQTLKAQEIIRSNSQAKKIGKDHQF